MHRVLYCLIKSTVSALYVSCFQCSSPHRHRAPRSGMQAVHLHPRRSASRRASRATPRTRFLNSNHSRLERDREGHSVWRSYCSSSPASKRGSAPGSQCHTPWPVAHATRHTHTLHHEQSTGSGSHEAHATPIAPPVQSVPQASTPGRLHRGHLTERLTRSPAGVWHWLLFCNSCPLVKCFYSLYILFRLPFFCNLWKVYK